MKFHLPPIAWNVSAHRYSSVPLSCALQGLRRLVAMGLAVLLLPCSQLDLLAQQAGPYYPQYPQYPQAAYPQPPYYPQPRAYTPQPSYSPYGPGQVQQQAYGQQAYYSAPPPSYGQSTYQGYGQTAMQPLTADQLDQLVAPVALYPDALVAQVLTASTYPAQVADADRWRQAQGSAPAEQIAAGADAQNWDPSVKALTAFPQVLEQMARNLRWTSDLGNAYYNQPEDLMEAVQQMRQRAQGAGNLQTNGQQTVSYDQGNIMVAPANPTVVYVPAYNPWAVYGPALSPYPGFYLLGALGSFLGSAVQFGLGIGIGAFSQLPFGWLGWGLSWLTHAVLFHNAFYFSHSTSVADWGFARGGRRAFANSFGRPSFGYGQNRGNNAYRNGFVHSPLGYGGRPVQQAFHRMQPAFNGRNPFATGGYRSSANNFGRNNFMQRSPNAFAGQGFRGYSGKAPSSGGFHPFGGGGGHAPKSFGGGGGHFGGFHSGGGHSGGGHSGGGGHFFGKHH